MASVGEVLFALGEVAGAVERAGRAVNEAETACRNALAGLTEAMAGSNDQDAGEAPEYMAMALSKVGDVDDTLHAILGKVSAIVGRLANPDGTLVPPGARAARAPVAWRGHPTHTPAPPPDQRDHEWAAQVGAQLTEFDDGQPTEALVFDAAGQDWQVNSGVDPKLTAVARSVIAGMIVNGEVGTSGDAVTDSAERTAMRDAAAHAETKAAVWAAAKGKTDVDVVTNRKFVCGDTYGPGDRQNPPGCAQAVAAILPVGYRMRVWRRGVAEPFVITGRGKKG